VDPSRYNQYVPQGDTYHSASASASAVYQQRLQQTAKSPAQQATDRSLSRGGVAEHSDVTSGYEKLDISRTSADYEHDEDEEEEEEEEEDEDTREVNTSGDILQTDAASPSRLSASGADWDDEYSDMEIDLVVEAGEEDEDPEENLGVMEDRHANSSDQRSGLHISFAIPEEEAGPGPSPGRHPVQASPRTPPLTLAISTTPPPSGSSSAEVRGLR
jgi:hypothetical protein